MTVDEPPQLWKATQSTMPVADKVEEAQPATAAKPSTTFPIGRSHKIAKNLSRFEQVVTGYCYYHYHSSTATATTTATPQKLRNDV